MVGRVTNLAMAKVNQTEKSSERSQLSQDIKQEVGNQADIKKTFEAEFWLTHLITGRIPGSSQCPKLYQSDSWPIAKSA